MIPVDCAQLAGQLLESASREIAADIEREGNPSEEIARMASQRHVDLIVLGRHPHNRLWQWAHGHTASKLLEKRGARY